MKKISVSFVLLAMFLVVVFNNTGLVSAKSPTVSVVLEIGEDKIGLKAPPEYTAILFDEDGNQLHRYNSVPSRFSIDIPAAAANAPSKNYAIRIIADDGSIGVRYFADREIENNNKVLSAGENHLPINLIPHADAKGASFEGDQPGLYRNGIIIKEATYSAGTAFTKVGELHACAKMYSSITLTANSEAGIEGKLKYAGEHNWASIGYLYKRTNTSTYTSQYLTNPADSTSGGKFVETEYSYKFDVYAQYDGNGDFVRRWEELKVDSLIGGLKLTTSVGGDLKPYTAVVAGTHGSRKLLQGGQDSSQSYNSSHTLVGAVNLFGASLDAKTSYNSGSHQSYYLWDINSSKQNPNCFSNYAMYSGVGSLTSNQFPVFYWTHD